VLGLDESLLQVPIQALDKRLVRHLAIDDLFQPVTQHRIVQTRIEVNIPVDLQEGHAGNVSSALVTVNKRMVECDTDHVQRSLSNGISPFVVGCILWPLQGTL
jgi:hypothetical protein